MIESLKWLHQSHTTADSLSVLLRYYNELSRRFLLQKRFPEVKTLHYTFAQSLNNELQTTLHKYQSQAFRIYRRHRDENIAEVIAYVRE